MDLFSNVCLHPLGLACTMAIFAQRKSFFDKAILEKVNP